MKLPDIADIATIPPPDLVAYFAYLDALRESAVTNMLAARPYLANEFALKDHIASAILMAWMETFDRDLSPSIRAALARAGTRGGMTPCARTGCPNTLREGHAPTARFCSEACRKRDWATNDRALARAARHNLRMQQEQSDG